MNEHTQEVTAPVANVTLDIPKEFKREANKEAKTKQVQVAEDVGTAEVLN